MLCIHLIHKYSLSDMCAWLIFTSCLTFAFNIPKPTVLLAHIQRSRLDTLVIPTLPSWKRKKHDLSLIKQLSQYTGYIGQLFSEIFSLKYFWKKNWVINQFWDNHFHKPVHCQGCHNYPILQLLYTISCGSCSKGGNS